MKYKWKFYVERQIYYSLFPVVWRPSYMSKGEWIFEFLRFRLVRQLQQRCPLESENKL